ncbi:hypothetical protein T484DRAFT_1791607, partial [Baffinella frigidus]
MGILSRHGVEYLRAAAVYTVASRINHSCAPNTARLDFFDPPPGQQQRHESARLDFFDAPPGQQGRSGGAGGSARGGGASKGGSSCKSEAGGGEGREGTNLRVQLRALADIQKGDEFHMHYLSMMAPFSHRQERLPLEYGFECVCERCSLDALYPPEEEEDEEEEEEEGEEEDGGDEEVEEEANGASEDG